MSRPTAFAKMRANRFRPRTPEARIRWLQGQIEVAERQQWEDQRKKAAEQDFGQMRRANTERNRTRKRRALPARRTHWQSRSSARCAAGGTGEQHETRAARFGCNYLKE
jgi:hypothetical protein